MTMLKVLAAISFLVSVGWVVAEPTFEPILAVIGSAIAVLSLYGYDYANETVTRQRQKVGKGSQGLQAGGDIHITKRGRESSDD